MPLTSENHLALVSQENMSGLIKQIMGLSSLVFHLKDYITQKTFYMLEEAQPQMIELHKICIGKLMVILCQENKNKGTTIGNLTQLIIDLGIMRKKY